jgi:hypothetical protein
VSRSWSQFKEFSCTNSCGNSGAQCHHRMRIVQNHTSDHVIVEIDPTDGARPGDAEWSFHFDAGMFDALIEVEHRALEADPDPKPVI